MTRELAPTFLCDHIQAPISFVDKGAAAGPVDEAKLLENAPPDRFKEFFAHAYIGKARPGCLADLLILIAREWQPEKCLDLVKAKRFRLIPSDKKEDRRGKKIVKSSYITE